MSPDLAILPPTKKVPLTREQALKRKRERAVQRRAARRAAGLCAQCGAQPPALDKALCAACAKHESDRWHRQRKGLKSRRQAAVKPVAKPKPAAAKPAAKTQRVRETVPCALCLGAVDVRRVVAQPTGPTWPRCVKCAQRVAAHVQGIKSARAARQDGEGEA